MQINQKAGLAFATALRSILRADPDIVLIGEIRDTRHGHDRYGGGPERAPGAHHPAHQHGGATPLRLTEMGIEPFLVTSAVGSVLTQRLARVLCKQCKEPYDASEKDFLAAGYKEAGPRRRGHLHSLPGRWLPGLQPHGIPWPDGAGRGDEHDRGDRPDDHRAGDRSSTSNAQACEQGMRTLRLDGLLKAVEGQTTLEEVLRVVV